MNVFVDILYSISSFLLVPVMVALLLFLAWGLLELGGFLRERSTRKDGMEHWRQFERRILQGECSLEDFFSMDSLPGFLAKFQEEGPSILRKPIYAAKVSEDLEIAARGKLGRMSVGIRIGPMLGLMGTLIPMGPALLGLSRGDMEQMAQNLAVAFSTTVLGLLVGGLFFVMSLSRRRWYAMDLVAVDFLCRIFEEGGGK
ncbi:MAG TPA: MotA/TolQ/ExbB proton channel family protein [Planctomycetes bacterium]|nr:MotA/TolQ/ExbB proton channel family protein [Planctomycetota bacterium]